MEEDAMSTTQETIKNSMNSEENTPLKDFFNLAKGPIAPSF